MGSRMRRGCHWSRIALCNIASRRCKAIELTLLSLVETSHQHLYLSRSPAVFEEKRFGRICHVSEARCSPTKARLVQYWLDHRSLDRCNQCSNVALFVSNTQGLSAWPMSGGGSTSDSFRRMHIPANRCVPMFWLSTWTPQISRQLTPLEHDYPASSISESQSQHANCRQLPWPRHVPSIKACCRTI